MARPGFRTGGLVANVVLAALVLWIVFPFLWALSCSFRPIDELYTLEPTWLPETWTLDNYVWALGEPAFVVPLVNSAVIALATSATSVGLGAVAAFGMTRFRYPGKRVVLAALLSTQMLPTMLLIIPIFLIFVRHGLYNTYGGLVLASTAWTLPYAVVLLRGFFSTLSVSLEEQARVDGCTRAGAFLRITLPLSAAGLVAVSVYVFIWSWGDVLFPLLLAKDIDRQTAALSLYNMMQSTRGATNTTGLIAAGVLFSLPAVLLFTALQRKLVEGMTAGALRE